MTAHAALLPSIIVSVCFMPCLAREDVVEVGIVDEIAGEEPLVAVPGSSCPLHCNSQGACVQKKSEGIPFCACHYGFSGGWQQAWQADRGGYAIVRV